ncbi:MAG: capsid protein [CRESS virus sp. ct1Gc25]|nr:MAG: capsid protein [CRESS virus sp. ct1Gc25]
MAHKRKQWFYGSNSVRRSVRQQEDGNTPELKMYDQSVLDTLIGTGTSWSGADMDPSSNTLFSPNLGVDMGQRIGRRCAVVGLDMNGFIDCNDQVLAVGADPAAICRIIVFQDTQTKGVQALGNLVMEAQTADAFHVITAFPSRDAIGRFIILKDMVYVMQNPAFSSLGSSGVTYDQQGIAKWFSFRIEFDEPVIVHFDASDAGSVADVLDNSFHVMASNSSSGLSPRLTYTTRVYYYDF